MRYGACVTDFLPAHNVIAAEDAQPTRTAVLMHGILGSKRNWRSFVRQLVRDLPDWRFVVPDHRQHGDSTDAPPPHTVTACADDVWRLLQHLGLEPEVVIGHSFGAKVALAFAEQYPLGLQQVWMLDATPGSVEVNEAVLARHEVVRVIRGLRQVPQPLASREDVVHVLGGMGFGPSLARWMTTNLRKSRKPAGGYVWRFGLDGVEDLLHSYMTTDMWPFVEDLPLDVALHVVRGDRSDIWSDEVLDRLAGADGEVRLHLLRDAGHWVHADNPTDLKALFVSHLEGL